MAAGLLQQWCRVLLYGTTGVVPVQGRHLQLTDVARALMQRSAFPTDQEYSRALNGAIGGSTDQKCIRLLGGNDN